MKCQQTSMSTYKKLEAISFKEMKPTLLNNDCSTSCAFFEARFFPSSSLRSLSNLDINKKLKTWTRRFSITVNICRRMSTVQLPIIQLPKWRSCLNRSGTREESLKTVKVWTLQSILLHLRWTSLIKCCGGINERSMSTRAITIFLDSTRYSSNEALAMATICKKEYTLICS
jgi:hypothetical protein